VDSEAERGGGRGDAAAEEREQAVAAGQGRRRPGGRRRELRAETFPRRWLGAAAEEKEAAHREPTPARAPPRRRGTREAFDEVFQVQLARGAHVTSIHRFVLYFYLALVPRVTPNASAVSFPRHRRPLLT
jgi:hypothetical protein